MNKLPLSSHKLVFPFLTGRMSYDTFVKQLSSDYDVQQQLGPSITCQLKTLSNVDHCESQQAMHLLAPLLPMESFERYRVVSVLQDLISKSNRFIESLYDSYDLYADGYFFMETVGVQHGLTFSNTYFDYYEWEKLSDAEKKASVDRIYPSVKMEAEKVLSWIEYGHIKITGKKNHDGLFTYLDVRSDFDLLQSFDNVNIKHKRPKWSSLLVKAKNQLRLFPKK